MNEKNEKCKQKSIRKRKIGMESQTKKKKHIIFKLKLPKESVRECICACEWSGVTIAAVISTTNDNFILLDQKERSKIKTNK